MVPEAGAQTSNSITLSLASSSGAEGNTGTTDIDVTVTVPVSTSNIILLELCYSGTATLDADGGTRTSTDDYQLVNSGTVQGSTFIVNGCIGITAASNTTYTRKIRVHGDTTAEAHETVIVTLRAKPGATLPSDVTISPTDNPSTYTITNDDPHTISVSVAASAQEGDSGHTDHEITLTATPAFPEARSLSDAYLDICFTGTAEHRSGLGSLNGEVFRYETDFEAADGSGGGRSIAHGTGCLRIDGSTSLDRLMRRAHDQGGGLFLQVLGDTRTEPDETVIVTLSRRTGSDDPTPSDILVSSTAGSATHTITNDEVPAVDLSVSAASVAEGSGVTVTATRAEANTSGSALSIPIRVKAAGTTAASSDYTLPASISIANNASTGTATLSAADDSADEPTETVIVELHTIPAGTRAGTMSEAEVAITDTDPTVVSLARVGTGDIAEGDTVEFTVTLGRALAAGETVDVPLSIGGTGVATSDWSLAKKAGMNLNTGVTLSGTNTATPNVRLSGAGAETATLVLTAADDGTAETGGESYVIALGPDGTGTNGFDRTTLGTNVGGGADPHSTAKTFSVQVDEPPAGSTLSIAMATASADEGDMGATAAYPVTFPEDPAWTGGFFEVKVCTSGTAKRGPGAGADYLIIDADGGRWGFGTDNCVTGDLGLPRSLTGDFRIQPIGDSTDEPDETVILTLSRAGADTPAGITIDSVAVGTPVARRPPHRFRTWTLIHPAPTSDI